MTDQRLTLHVPDPVVPTSMNLGAAWSGTPPDAGTAWNGRGLCVNTTGRVWLDANGATSAASTFAAISNAATGQLLFQSISNTVMCFSKEKNIISSNSGVLIAGGGGVKMIAGHGAPVLFGVGDNSLRNVRPDETNPANDHLAGYENHVKKVADGWTIADTVVAATLTALDIGLLIAECCKGSKAPSLDLGMGLMVMGSAANLAGLTVNSEGLKGGDLPGIQLHAFSNISLATTGFCSVHSGAGLLLFGGMTSGLGFLTAGVTGFVSASLNSLLMTTVEGKNASLTGSTKLELNARTGPWNLSAPKVQIGANEFTDTLFAKTQMRTMKIKAEAVTSLGITASVAGKIELDSTGSTVYEGGIVEVDALTEVTIRSPIYKITVAVDGITVSVNTATKVAVTADSVMFDAVGAQALKVDATSVKIGGKTASLQVDASGSIVWTTPLANFL